MTLYNHTTRKWIMKMMTVKQFSVHVLHVYDIMPLYIMSDPDNKLPSYTSVLVHPKGL